MPTKDLLLAYLKEDKGNWISGESLSRKMAISRSAVWKQIHRLKGEGYVIDSSRKKGYLLRQSSDLLLESEVLDKLRTRIFGRKKIFHFVETDSTNIRAKVLADQGEPEGTIVIAESQTVGRGRRGRTWFSPSGEGIYVSLILRPALPPDEISRLTLLASVAVAETLLALTSLPVKIKWPNDLIAGGKKLGGILTQVSTEMDAVDYVIIGLGLNVHTPANGFPEDLRDKATSIFRETGAPCSRIDLLRLYLEKMETWYNLSGSEGFSRVLERWKELSDVIGRQVSVDFLNGRHTGEVLDIDESGALILRDQEGKLQRIVSGDISLLDE
jgi:BirA family biotin operon repressor/biotin-[acetyl-CoA-carboxylase] ligase